MGVLLPDDDVLGRASFPRAAYLEIQMTSDTNNPRALRHQRDELHATVQALLQRIEELEAELRWYGEQVAKMASEDDKPLASTTNLARLSLHADKGMRARRMLRAIYIDGE